MDKRPTKYEDIIAKVVEPSERLRLISEDPYVAEGRIIMPYRYFAGAVGTRFFDELKENRKIFGVKCPECKLVYVPPRPTCGPCFRDLIDWVEVGSQGTVVSFTVANYSLPIHPRQGTIIYAMVKLDGADTALTHTIAGVEPEEVRMGMRVQAIFKRERQGNILDIDYFGPL